MKENYEEIKHIIQSGILKENYLTIQKKMIELSKMNNINAIKLLYLIINLQYNNESYLSTNLDYQDSNDKSTVCINLANNTVKASYRLLDLIINSFYINPYLTDERGSTLYGYLMAHLIQIYKSDNNFHSRNDLEKLMVKLSKNICELYPFNINDICYKDRNGRNLSYNELVMMYRKKNSYYLDKKSDDGSYQKMNKILKNMNNETTEIIRDECTKIKDFDRYLSDERFTKYKRYTLDTLNFAKKYI